MTDLLGTPNIGTGFLEHRDRVDFGALRDARRARVLTEMKARGLDACFFGREANARYVSGVRRLWTAQTRPFAPGCLVVLEPVVWRDGIGGYRSEEIVVVTDSGFDTLTTYGYSPFA